MKTTENKTTLTEAEMVIVSGGFAWAAAVADIINFAGNASGVFGGGDPCFEGQCGS